MARAEDNRSIDQLQRNLNAYLDFYNRERANQGYGTQGRTLYQAFLDGVEAMRGTEVNPEAAEFRSPERRVSGDPQLRTGHLVNHKRVRRLWRVLGLTWLWRNKWA